VIPPHLQGFYMWFCTKCSQISKGKSLETSLKVLFMHLSSSVDVDKCSVPHFRCLNHCVIYFNGNLPPKKQIVLKKQDRHECA
jgi:hypothetical protein